MDYDVLILGGSIIGCAIAYELSKYNINIALIEKDYDVANDISYDNVSVIYDGSEAYDYKMAKLENRGMNLIKKHCEKFNVKYNEIGSIRFFKNQDDNHAIEDIYENANTRGIYGVHVIEENMLSNIDANLRMATNKALYSENTAIIYPYDLAISYAEIAADNGVNFRLEEEVIDIKTISKGFKVTTNKNKFTCKFVINTIQNDIFENRFFNNKNEVNVKNTKCTIYENNLKDNINTIIIENINNNDFVVNIPYLSNNETFKNKIDDILKLKKIENQLEGARDEIIHDELIDTYDKDNLFICDNELEDGYINIIGNHYAKINVVPVIAEEIEKKIKINMNITKKRDYIDKKREMYIFRNMTKEEINKVISLDKRYGNIICNCNNISEGEIIDSIRRPLGARTLEGVKRRTGIGLGNCNGSYCNIKIMKILAREMDKSVLSIVDNSMDSQILVGRIKEFNEI